MRKPLLLLVGLLFLFGFSATSFAQEDKGGQRESTGLAAHETSFVDSAASSGAYGLELAKMAVEKSENADVKDFANAMVSENESMNDTLGKIAESKNITTTKTLSSKQNKELAELSKLSGKKFDKKFLSIALKEHRSTLKAFEKEVKSGKDPDLKSFATTTIPTLKRHIQMGERVQQKLRHY